MGEERHVRFTYDPKMVITNNLKHRSAPCRAASNRSPELPSSTRDPDLGTFWCTFKDRGLIGLVPRPLTSQFRTPAALPLHAPDDLARNG